MRRFADAPVFSLGFRPFFLAGAGFGAIAVGLWAVWLYGHLPTAQPPGGMLAWHRHEMPFGFAGAIIAGFLLTAVPNWTGRPGLSGWPLAGLIGVWLLARLAWFLPFPGLLILGLQVAFLPLLAWVLGRDLLAAGKRENYPILMVLVLLAGCQVMTLSGIALADINLQRHGVLAALWLVGALMTVIGGRVIPFFIQRGLNRGAGPSASPLPGKVLLVSALLAALSFAVGLNDAPRPWLAGLFALMGVLHLLRLWRWHDRGLWRVPLLWSLYLAYAWLVVATLGMALWHAGVLSQQSLATHALAVGGVGGLILAMIVRVSLGHTGRVLRPSRVIVAAFVLLLLGGVCRVGLVPVSGYGVALSAVLWCAAFGVFVWRYAGILVSPRM
jgi:uncharacterized protein involved in response to NO